ncbi:MAG: DUF2309 domain-containing protein [Myxococcales bacterium]|nr:DUF2309 domain-containing protein [Myxococcales bacterium]
MNETSLSEYLCSHLDEVIEHARHLLPTQNPLSRFVHHNTLHAFEDLPFEQAVLRASEVYGAEPYAPEREYRLAYEQGRILDRDLDQVLAANVPEDSACSVGGSSRERVRSLMLFAPEVSDPAAIAWQLEEARPFDALSPSLSRAARESLLRSGPAHIVLPKIWSRCLQWATLHPTSSQKKAGAEEHVRLRDFLMGAWEIDTDLEAHPVLVRWCAAYLDMGISYWPTNEREQGFFRWLVGVLNQPSLQTRPWKRRMAEQARRFLADGMDAKTYVTGALERLGLAPDQVEEYVLRSLMALRGWAGMFGQLKARPDLAPKAPPPTVLMEFLAARLWLDEVIALDAFEEHDVKASEDLLGVARRLEQESCRVRPASYCEDARQHSRAWLFFGVCQALGLTPTMLESLSPKEVRQFVQFVDEYHERKRRGLWHLAYERRYRVEVFDGVLAHQEYLDTQPKKPKKPEVQFICCIDDREESLRRYIEEINPAYETLGAAGFFGVAIYHRRLREPLPTPLCPGPIIPQHYIDEIPVDAGAASWVDAVRRSSVVTNVAENVFLASKTLVRGAVSSMMGWTAIAPMIGRIWAPKRMHELTQSREKHATRLTVEREEGTTYDGAPRTLGYTIEEMTKIVYQQLLELGLTKPKLFAPLVVFLGHGSHSQNNPHSAAYNCGACGGGRGGPNARAFAEMANHEKVRAGLLEKGISIPDSTWFLGGYHDTCDDNVIFYDEDRLPVSLKPTFKKVVEDIEVARRRDAHERCRRFMSAPLSLSSDEALAHVENRSEDLAQPRPEYGHTTNALCLVGDRSWSRGLFLDRRAFLTSYAPSQDEKGSVLAGILASVAPVVAGINLEYYFSYVDTLKYGSNSKLPHNVSGLLGVMEGECSDLRTGLPWQMVEIHEPLRLLCIVEASPENLMEIIKGNPTLQRLFFHGWLLLAAFRPEEKKIWYLQGEEFVLHQSEEKEIPVVPSSLEAYQGLRGNCPPASIAAGSIRLEVVG